MSAASCSVEKPLAQHKAVLSPLPVESLSSSGPPPSTRPRAGRIIRFHIQRQQNHLQRNHPLSPMLQSANAAHALAPGALGAVKNIPTGGWSGGGIHGRGWGWGSSDSWLALLQPWQPQSRSGGADRKQPSRRA